MFQNKKIFISIVSFFLVISLIISNPTVYALSSDTIAFVILSDYNVSAPIGKEFYILAITSNGSLPTWKSNDSKIASVNTYGKVTTKKAGAALITAKIHNAEASCVVTVTKTKITISTATASMERGQTLRLTATTSNNSPVTWKSSKKSVAMVDEYGTVTSKKPGETMITATADGSSTACTLTVKSPTLQLSKSSIQLYRNQTYQLYATVSSKINPIWKTNKKSVSTVDATGRITAQKHGTAIITATVDGVSKTCEVIVIKPNITLSSTELTLTKGAHVTLTASVSSGNTPQWSSSNTNVVTVNSTGDITALQKGKAYVYAAEDGTKAKCTIYVTN